MFDHDCHFSTINGGYSVKTLLGKGKSGYSYRVDHPDGPRVLKIMHDEPVPFYSFQGNKVQAEVAAYERLHALGIPMPELLAHDAERGCLLKAYIDGPTAARLIADGGMTDAIFGQLFGMARTLEAAGINIDYFPNNFVIDGVGQLFYIDYEINAFDPSWSLRSWGIYYWLNADGMARFLATGDGAHINADSDNGIPHKVGFEEEVDRLAGLFG
jgi:TP53 regulating kinase-like protein